MVRTKLYNGCSHTPMIERPQHPTRGQFTPEASQTQAPVTFATEPARRAGGGFTQTIRAARRHAVLAVERISQPVRATYGWPPARQFAKQR